MVFIGPCVAKRKEAQRDEAVDFIMTFEEMASVFAGLDIQMEQAKPYSMSFTSVREAHGFAQAGGVMGAVKAYLKEEADKLLKDYMILLQKMEEKMNRCFSNYGIGNKCTEKLLDNFVRFIRILMQLPGMTGNLMLLTDLDENVDKIGRIIEHGRKRDEFLQSAKTII